MEIVQNTMSINRKWFTTHSSCGIFQIDNAFQCFSLEDVSRGFGIKIPKETCIPALDNYLVIINMSNRFKKLMPLIFNNEHDLSVIDNHGVTFTGVRIHSGNNIDDTDACVLPGNQRKTDWVSDSVNAYEALYGKLFDLIGVDKAIRLSISHHQE